MIIYCATRIDDGRKYVGKTIGTLKWRRYFHENLAKRGSKLLFHRMLLKHEFGWVILEECKTEEQLNQREIFWIAELKTNNLKRGFNLTEGGTGGPVRLGMKHSEETKEKIRQSLKGKCLSNERKKKIGDAVRVSQAKPEIKAKMSTASKGRKQSPETIAKRVAKMTGKHWKWKKIIRGE